METATKILAVAIGGAFGAVLRYLITISPMNDWLKPFPFPTFFINITGSFLIGFAIILFSERFGASETLRLMLAVGFLGAFTTFSTFEFEIWSLVKENNFFAAFLYFFLSVLFGFIGVALGISLAKKF